MCLFTLKVKYAVNIFIFFVGIMQIALSWHGDD